MNDSFDDFSAVAQARFGWRVSPGESGSFSLATDLGPFSFFRAAGDPDAAFVRFRLAEPEEVSDGLAVDALGANFFWAGANGATLSLGPDGALYATERRLASELCADGGLDSCLADFLDTIESWKERTALHA